MHTNPKVDTYIESQPEWQQTNLKLFRKLVHATKKDVAEDIKWGVPVFLVNGKTLLAMSTFKKHTKYNFFNGSNLRHIGLFNNGLDSKISRGIDLREGETIDEDKLSKVINESIKKAMMKNG